MKTAAEKLKRVSFTMHPKYVQMLSLIAETNAGSTMSHAVRRLIQDEYDRIKRMEASGNGGTMGVREPSR